MKNKNQEQNDNPYLKDRELNRASFGQLEFISLTLLSVSNDRINFTEDEREIAKETLTRVRQRMHHLNRH